MTSFDPRRPDFAPYGFTCEQWRPTAMDRPDRHNEIEINLLRSGSISYLLGGRRILIPALRLSAFWAALPHQIVSFEAPTEYFVATLPLAWFLQCRLPQAMVHRLLQGEVVMESDGERGAADLHLLGTWEKDLHETHEAAKRVVLLELEARLLRLSRSGAYEDIHVSRRTRALSQPGLSKVEQMAYIIAQRYTHPLTVDEIGQKVNLHPNYAMGLFKKTFGITLIDYLTKQRVSHAQRMLATTDTKITAIAHSSGFNSTSRFNAAFLAECGCSPREYRHQQQSGYRKSVAST